MISKFPADLPRIWIKRLAGDNPLGTFGDLFLDLLKPSWCKTLERPRTGDHPCIPAGEYLVRLLDHPEHGLCLEVTGVLDRTAILIHAANWFFELLGCIALGRTHEIVEGDFKGKHYRQEGITASGPTVREFMAIMGAAPFVLNIE